MPKKDSLHRVDYYLGIVKALGCDVGGRGYDFFIARQDEEFADEFFKKEGLKENDFVVCLNPGGIGILSAGQKKISPCWRTA